MGRLLATGLLVLAACSAPVPQSDDRGRPDPGRSGITASSSPAGAQETARPTPTVPPAEPTPASSSDEVGTTEQASPAPPATAPGETDFEPIASGEYRYEQQIRGDELEETVGTLWAAEPSNDYGSTSQALKRIYMPGPDGWSRFLDIVWEQESIFIRSESHPGEGRGTPPCDYEEPHLFVRSPLEPGQTWSSRTACSDWGEDRGSVSRQAEVLGEDTVTVEGQPVRTVLIEEELLRTRSDGSVRTESSRLWFSPEHARILKSEIAVSDQQEGDLAISSVLVSLTPGELPFG